MHLIVDLHWSHFITAVLLESVAMLSFPFISIYQNFPQSRDYNHQIFRPLITLPQNPFWSKIHKFQGFKLIKSNVLQPKTINDLEISLLCLCKLVYMWLKLHPDSTLRLTSFVIHWQAKRAWGGSTSLRDWTTAPHGTCSSSLVTMSALSVILFHDLPNQYCI